MSDLTCAIDGCETPRKIRSKWCSKHTARIARHGDPHFTTQHRTAGIDLHDWDALIGACTSRQPGTNGCWLWTQNRNPAGYGVVVYQGRNQYAHRMSYISAVGPITDGLTVDHTCFTPACVRPDHLRLLPNKENAGIRARGDFCRNGHAFAPENTYWTHHSSGKVSRRCRACFRAGNERRRQTRAA